MDNEKLSNQNKLPGSRPGLLYEDLTYKIRGAIFNVYNSIGYGHKESVYQRALAFELSSSKVKFEYQKAVEVQYKNLRVGIYIPDLIIENKIILELKASEYNIKRFEKQLLNYLKSTNFKLGLLVNFGRETLSIKRLIN